MKMALTEGKVDDLKIEIVGILTNLNMGDKWEEFLTPTFIEFLHSNLTQGVTEDDIILATIELVSSICDSVKCAEILASNYIYYNIRVENVDGND